MKSIMNIVGIAFIAVLAACSGIEPIDMKVSSVPKDLVAINTFKSTEHPRSLAWFSNWKADGNMNTYLNTLPDSLDIIVVESGYEVLSAYQKEDLSVVRMQKGTKVLISVDVDHWINELQTKMEAAESDAEAEVEDLAKEEGREVTPEELQVAIQAAYEKVKTAWKIKLNGLPERITKLTEEIGYDGVSLRISAVKDSFAKECIYEMIDKLGKNFGMKVEGKLLILEGDVFYFTSRFSLFNYLIQTSENIEKRENVQAQYDRLKRVEDFNAKQFMTYLSLDGKSWNDPFPDIISSLPLTEPRYITLALWRPKDGTSIGGMAIRAVEKDYERKYSVLRNTLQYLNLK